MSGSTFKVGDLLNNTYRIEAVLGRGGTSEVYQARSEISGNRVALKVLRAEFSKDEGFLNLITREEDIREIRHDAVVRYYHNQRNENNDIFLVMDFIDGPGLDKKLKQGGMSATDLLVVAERVAEGLKAAHDKLIVHRDLSPDNIILRNGNPAEAVIIDFGIAKDSNPGAETVVGNEFAGKYAYAAPEQLSGKSDARSDIYALGALLLATFRGKSPDAGSNPLEVIERKGRPLDTDGVPEPLKTLIDRMTDPAPERRPQDAGAVLDLIRGEAQPDAANAPSEDATVIAPRPARPAPSEAEVARKAGPGPKPSGRGGMIALIGAAAVATGGLGAYLLGAFDPLLTSPMPVADPFRLLVERPADGTATAIGNVPDDEIAAELAQIMSDLGGQSDLMLARGEIAAGWGETVVDVVARMEALPEWRVEVTGNHVSAAGMALDPAQYDRVSTEMDRVAMPAGMRLETTLELGPRILPVSRILPVLEAHADCGALRLMGPPPLGYTNDDRIVVGGKLADPATRQSLETALSAIAGMRSVEIAAEVLNPTLCIFDTVLPNVSSRGFEIVFREGESGAAMDFGNYTVGQNPVIDLVIPAGVTSGYLFVSALDVSGKVFHLLPNMNRPDNDVAALRGGLSGPVTVRLAHTLAEAADSGGKKLAFVVDDSALGKTEILVIHSEEQFLDGMRPTTESASAYAEALDSRRERVGSLDTRLLTTTLP